MRTLQTHLWIVLLAAICANRAAAQTPPNEPNDFSTHFTALDLQNHDENHDEGDQGNHGHANVSALSDGEGFQNFNLSYPGITGVQWGNWYRDFTNKREAFYLGSPAPGGTGATSTVAVFIFYDKHFKYVYHSPANTCTKTTINTTIVPFFAFLANAKPEAGGNNMTQLWNYQLNPAHGIEFGSAANTANTPVFVLWRTPDAVTTLTFDAFTSGQPDASVFNLPAACAI